MVSSHSSVSLNLQAVQEKLATAEADEDGESSQPSSDNKTIM